MTFQRSETDYEKDSDFTVTNNTLLTELHERIQTVLQTILEKIDPSI